MENSTYSLHAFPLPIDSPAITPEISRANYTLFIGECGNLCREIEHKGLKSEKLETGADALKWLKEKHFRHTSSPNLIVINTRIDGLRPFDFVKSLATIKFLRNVPVIFISCEFSAEERDLAIRVGASDYFTKDINPEDFIQRLTFLARLKELNESTDGPDDISVASDKTEEFQIWPMKRAFDIVLATLLLLIFSPIMILIALAIKLDSRGPVLYISKRAGKGYQIFDFYKFRTMKSGAEAQMEKLKHLNIYNEVPDQDSLFFKARNDPRTTTLGTFLRRTSLDEFPQLFNVLKGDMSIVGNRPLPLYEAEKLTQDQWAIRFAAPAGITGLWQIKKNEQMSEQERIALDIAYARDNSFLSDLKLIMKTPLVVFQKEEKQA